MRFQSKVAVLTGAGSGIGKETARRLVAEGSKVVINGRNKVKLEAAAKEIDPTGANVAILAGDIALPSTGQSAVALAVERFGRLDILVNNAGVFNPKPFLELTESDYDWYLDTILKGKFFTAQAAAKAMQEHGGVIVQTGSMWLSRQSAPLPLRRIPPRMPAFMRWCETWPSNSLHSGSG